MGQEWLKADNFPAMILCSLKPKVNAYLWFCNTNQEEYVFALERDAIPPEVSPLPPSSSPLYFSAFPDSSLLPTTKWSGGLGELSVFKVTNHSDPAYL